MLCISTSRQLLCVLNVHSYYALLVTMSCTPHCFFWAQVLVKLFSLNLRKSWVRCDVYKTWLWLKQKSESIKKGWKRPQKSILTSFWVCTATKSWSKCTTNTHKSFQYLWLILINKTDWSTQQIWRFEDAYATCLKRLNS